MFLVGCLELEMLKEKALNVGAVLGYMAKRKHPQEKENPAETNIKCQ